MDMEWTRKCDVCGGGFTKRSWEDHHSPHAKECPNFEDFSEEKKEEPWYECDCDYVTHPGCCPQCEAGKVRRYWDLQAVKEAISTLKNVEASQDECHLASTG